MYNVPALRVHTEWRLPISVVHPILMEKSALAGEGGGCTPTPFQPNSITYKVAVYASDERADTLPLFHRYPIPVCTRCTYPIRWCGGESINCGI
jgi:hypothetical protein